MINFSTLQGLTIPEGVVTQIADASGRVLWSSGKPIILEVEKITSNTYAGETTYENEEFILLDIYPKTNGTVKVTYGGLTKTITDTSGAEEPNAQQVYFGTFNGVADSVETPASGTLAIEGDYVTFGVGQYSTVAKSGISCSCITSVIEWGITSKIADSAFNMCSSLALTSLPDGITSIGNAAFYRCSSLALTSLPDSITSIGSFAFNMCSSLALTSLPDGITSIGSYAFGMCPKITSIIIPSSVTFLGANSLACQDVNNSNHLNVKMLGTIPPELELLTTNVTCDAFGSKSIAFNGTITVPKGCGETYKNAPNWEDRKSYIVEES